MKGKLLILIMATIMLCGCENNKIKQTVEKTVAMNSKNNELVTTESNKEEPRKIDGFEKADYEKFNSSAKKRKLMDTLIFIEGESTTKIEEEDFLGFILNQEDGKGWVVSLTDKPQKDEQIADELLKKNIRVFGSYLGYSNTYHMPIIAACCSEGGRIDEEQESGEFKTIWDFNEYYKERFSNVEVSNTKITSDKISDSDKKSEKSKTFKKTEKKEDNKINQENKTDQEDKTDQESKTNQEGKTDQESKTNQENKTDQEGKTKEENSIKKLEQENTQTIGEENALRKAKEYLEFVPFSYQGLIEQLVFDQFSHEEATYAADHCNVDWKEQALKKAKAYLDYLAFSYTGMITQLKYDNFTDEEATYAADHCNIDWKEQASKKAREYLNYLSFSREELIQQLEYDGFTYEQAVYGVTANGY